MRWIGRRDVATDERLALRQAQSAPVLAQIRQKLLLWKEQLLPKHPMAEVINYALSQWQEMNVFCSEGAVAIDNNSSEREMKRVILNRKNSLFVGNPRGGRTAAILASLTSTCRSIDQVNRITGRIAKGNNDISGIDISVSRSLSVQSVNGFKQ